jgi:hypothetical protein
MNAHFSKDVLRQDLECLANRPKSDDVAEPAGRAACAEAGFENDSTVQHAANLAHLTQQPAA